MSGRLMVLVGTALLAGQGTKVPPKVGTDSGKGIVVNTGQTIRPDGQLSLFSARPVDLVLSPDGKMAYLKENEGLTVVEVSTVEIRQRLPIRGGASLTGLALSTDGTKLYYSNSGNDIVEIDVASKPAKVIRTLSLPNASVGGPSYPCGLLVVGDKLYAALSRANRVIEIDLASGTPSRSFNVAPAPFDLAWDATTNELWVSSWGASPRADELRAPSSGTPVVVDRRGIAVVGVVSQIGLELGKLKREIRVGPQPSEIALRDGRAYVAVASGDEVVVIDRVGLAARTVWRSTRGAAPNSLAWREDGKLDVACGGSNEVVVLDGKTFRPVETYRSGWYPTAVRSRAGNLFVASAKGVGSRGNDLREGKLDAIARTEKFAQPLTPEAANQKGVYQFTGALSVIRATTKSGQPAVLPTSLPPRPNAKPVPIPERPGEPSVFKHVVYVLKENRTYDQVFGDISGADGDPKLCIYGENITPNHHALAREYGLLDNYYCNGVLSADGHSWSTEGNATSYFERSFGGWTRSYPYGDDPIAISPTGHIWDAILDKGLTFKNYGEYDYAEPTKGENYAAVLKDFLSGERKVQFRHKIGVERLRRYSDTECPGWNMGIPDILRASYFVRDIKRAKTLPSFNFVYLPQDHTSGGGAGSPSPNAHLADNDLALGRVVEAVSNSRFWRDTVIFVVEDDPQAGFDHVDGHRSICLAISAYSKRKAVVSKFYNQGSVLKSIRHIFGIPAATRTEMEASLMSDCFQAKPDLAPYRARPNNVRLDETNPSRSTMKRLDLRRPDLADENVFNRQLWTLAKPGTRYPAHLAGAHGKGLAAGGLRSVDVADD